jgi:membrane-associated phospholipid phosphatase
MTPAAPPGDRPLPAFGAALTLPDVGLPAAARTPHQTALRTRLATWLPVVPAIYACVYIALYLSGYRVFVYKTALVPAFLLYGMAVRDRVGFLRDWAPFIAGVIAFDACRGAIYDLVSSGWLRGPVHLMGFESLIFRTPAAPLVLQPFRHPVLDVIAIVCHGSHFLFFPLFGLTLWHVDRPHFALFRRTLLIVMGAGLTLYAAVPAAPPWLDAALGALPPIPHLVDTLYTGQMPTLAGAFDTNPIAAMPSLHVAFPTACALVGARAWRPSIAAALWVYAAGAMFSAMYLGEHYAVDVVAGVGVAYLSVWAADRVGATARRTPSEAPRPE